MIILAEKKINLPISKDDIENLNAGDKVLLNGWLFTARDAAHKRLYDALCRNEKLPIDINGETVYYLGPSPTPKGKIIGSAGPTTSTRMDKYTPLLLKNGIKAMLGKGRRSGEVIDAMIEQKAVYFAAIGGCGALLARHIAESEVVCYDDLGTEAIRKLKVKDFPCIVAIDCRGNNLYDLR